MIARFDLQSPFRPPAAARPVRKRRQLLSADLLVIGALSAFYAGWLVYRVAYMPTWLENLSPMLGELIGLVELAGGLTLGLLWGIVAWRRGHPATALKPLERDDLYTLHPVDFERFVAQLFRQKGYHVKLRGKSGDHGVDLELRQLGGKRAIVQCKRYRTQVGPDVVRELYGTLIHEQAAHAFLVTTADISQTCRDWAQGKPITLIDGRTLLHVASKLAAEP